MADTISQQRRSWNMSRIKDRDTKPELTIRKALHKRGYRYRIHYKVDGKPDIAFPSTKLAVFIHGCFWHQHGCKYTYRPRTRKRFWNEKLDRNISRDTQVAEKLRDRGWEIMTIWACEIKNNPDKVIEDLTKAIDGMAIGIMPASTS